MVYITYKEYMQYLRQKHMMELKEDEQDYEYESEYDIEKVKEVNKKHDKMMRRILSKEKEMVKFINDFLKIDKKIKEGEIVQCKSDFITRNYKDRQSDIIYKIKNKPVYFLVEHQSTVRKDMLERVWEYVGQIIRLDKMNKKEKLEDSKIYPIVVPIVIYTGYQKWNEKTNFEEKQYNAKEYEEYRIKLKYNLVAVQDYTFKELKEKESVFGIAMIIEKCKTAEEMEREISKILDGITNVEEIELIEEIIEYVVEPMIGKKKAEEMLEKLDRKEEEKMSPFGVKIDFGHESVEML